MMIKDLQQNKMKEWSKLMRIRCTIYFLVAAALLCITNANAATWYVAQSSSGTGDGKSYANRMSNTSHTSNRSIAAGDTVYVCGAFSNRIKINNSGSSSAPITYRGDYGADTFSSNKLNGAFYIDGQDYIHFYNAPGAEATIDGGDSYGRWFTEYANDNAKAEESYHLFNIKNAEYIDIEGWNLYDGWTGIRFTDCAHVSVKRCDIRRQSYDGIMLYRVENAIIGGAEADGNILHHCTHYRSGYYKNNQWHKNPNRIGADIRMIKCKNVIASYNECVGSTILGSDWANTKDWWGQAGIKAEGLSNAVFEYNSIYNHAAHSFRAGIHVKSPGSLYAENIVIRRNRIYDGPLKDRPYVGAPAIGITRNSSKIYICENWIDNYKSGISYVHQSEGGKNEGYDGIPTHDFYIWANSISNVDIHGFGITDGLAANEDDIYNIRIWNNTIAYASDAGMSFRLDGSCFDGIDRDGKSFPDSQAPQVVVKNNIIYRSGEGESAPASLHISKRMWNDTTVKGDETGCLNIDHNSYYEDNPNEYCTSTQYTSGTDFMVCSPPGPSTDCNTGCDTRVRWYNDTEYPSTYFVGSLKSNQFLSDPSNGNLRLTSNSTTVIDAGTDVSGISIPSANISNYPGGSVLTFSADSILSPSSDFSSHPPVIVETDNSQSGSGREMGAFVYTNDSECPDFVAGPDACTSSCPCGEGQGDCDSDTDCENGLTCVQNVGAEYGWPESRDVCE